MESKEEPFPIPHLSVVSVAYDLDEGSSFVILFTSFVKLKVLFCILTGNFFLRFFFVRTHIHRSLWILMEQRLLFGLIKTRTLKSFEKK